MKKILFAIGLMIGFGQAASAQDSKYAQNYKICRSETGYQVCADQSQSNLNGEKSYMEPDGAKRLQVPCYSPISVSSRPPAMPLPKVAKENTVGEANDGFEQNAKRNLNYGNNTQLAPNTGEIR